ncbi:MAG: hypothetical protein LBQ45_00430 [Mycoplasmataceae bacterium]|jgi:hypothetical protein|nr:hypothetical protein [Mycoplasmataceae bacterium]
MCAILNGLAIIISLIIGLVLPLHNLIWASLLFIPFGFIYIFINEKFSYFITAFRNNKSFSRFIFFFTLSFTKYLCLLVPLIVTCATYSLNIFNIYMAVSETVAFCLLLVSVSLIKFKK